MGRRIDLPREAIIVAYAAGSSAQELAIKYGVGSSTIQNRLYEWNVEVRAPSAHFLGKHLSADHRRKISEALHRYQANWEDNGGSDSNVSEGPPSPIDARRQQILDLEEKVAVAEVNFRQACEELAILKGGGVT